MSGFCGMHRGMTEPSNPGLDDLPSAVPARSRWGRLSLIWVLPAVVILAGTFVVIHEKLAQGISIEIRFHNAEDLDANKTKIRYKDVEIGEVRDIRVGADRREVIVTAEIHRNAQSYLVEDPRFWVVRPRVSGAGVSGLATLVSGAYISVDVGHSAVSREQASTLLGPPPRLEYTTSPLQPQWVSTSGDAVVVMARRRGRITIMSRSRTRTRTRSTTNPVNPAWFM